GPATRRYAVLRPPPDSCPLTTRPCATSRSCGCRTRTASAPRTATRSSRSTSSVPTRGAPASGGADHGVGERLPLRGAFERDAAQPRAGAAAHREDGGCADELLGGPAVGPDGVPVVDRRVPPLVRRRRRRIVPDGSRVQTACRAELSPPDRAP